MIWGIKWRVIFPIIRIYGLHGVNQACRAWSETDIFKAEGVNLGFEVAAEWGLLTTSQYGKHTPTDEVPEFEYITETGHTD